MTVSDNGRVRGIVGGLVRLASWLFGRRAAGLDVALGIQAAGWGGWMLAQPAFFDTSRFAGFAWLPDPAWIAIMIALAGLHGLALALPERRNVRVAAALFSSWLWMFVAICLWRAGFGPGVLNYGVIGIGALFAAIFVGLPADEG